MQELIISPYFLAALFFVVAFLYASVGMGGGSSYTALQAIFGVSYVAIPSISLILNLIVTSVGSFNFIRQRHARWRLIVPFFVTSIPMAYVGGSLQLPKEAFYWLLLTSLVFVALRLYVWDSVTLNLNLGTRQKLIVSLIAGSILGFIAGTVGIGGGIYLVPLIIVLGLGTAKEAAACGAIFVWVNSLAGLLARVQYHEIEFIPIIPLIIAVLLGGTLGSYMGAARFTARTMERILGLIVVIAVIFLARKLLLPWFGV